jgi:hypothetical protein
MREIAPGLWHWTVHHERIAQPVSSYHLAEPGVALNPMLPPEGAEWFAAHGGVYAVVLTNRHHLRGGHELCERFDAPVHVPHAGADEVRGEDRDVRPYGPGDELPGGLVAHAVGAISPDEGAVLAPCQRALAVADGVIRIGDGPLQFVPDFLMGDDPAAVKAGLLEAFAPLAELDFDHLLLAHGDPVVGDGSAALRAFVAGSAG